VLQILGDVVFVSKVVAALTQAITGRGDRPRSITLDNGTEFAGRAMEASAMQVGVQLCFIRPGRSVENGFIESFKGRLRDECLNVEWFTSLEEARQGLALWRDHYNHRRPHSALDDWPPAVFAGLHGIQEKRFALFDANRTSGKPRQGFASPAEAALDRPRRLPEDIQYQGEALLGIAHSRDSLLSLRSDFQARKTGSGRP
jgi:putative transposase